MNVLIVEDDDDTARKLEQILTGHGYTAQHARTGAEALDSLPDPGLVLLDLGLPDLDGHELCRRIRERSCVPIITVSSRTDEVSRVMALHLGADDFVPKPFSTYELIARVQALLRRTAGCRRHTADGAPPAEPLRAGPLRVDARARRAELDGEEIRLTRKEFDLLLLLLREPGTVRARQEIMSQVWQENWFGSTRTLDVHVGSLRSKLGSGEWIETVRGVGYRLTVPPGIRPAAAAPGAR